MGHAVFITGTDTGVGKTWISAALAKQALAQGQRVAYYKPMQTGTPVGEPPEDPHFVETHVPGVATFCRYCFVPPVTPSVADTNGLIDLEQIAHDIDDYRQAFDLVLVEGAGGLMAPVSNTIRMVELIEQLTLPVVLVSQVKLGTINHTLLSIEALTRRGIKLNRLVFNYYPEDLTQADIAVQTLLPAIAPFLPKDLPLWQCPETSLDGLAPLRLPKSSLSAPNW